MKCWFSFRNK